MDGPRTEDGGPGRQRRARLTPEVREDRSERFSASVRDDISSEVPGTSAAALTTNAGRPSSVLGLLSVLQLADSFFPTGMFAHSHGLEGMVQRGLVRSADDVERLLEAVIGSVLLPSDGVALLESHRAAGCQDLDTIVAIDRRLFVMKLPTELRHAAIQFGRRLVAETVAFHADPLINRYREAVETGAAPGTGAVAFGAICQRLGSDADTALLGYCHGYLVGCLSAGVRLLVLTHSEAQAALHRLHAVVERSREGVRGRLWAEMESFSPWLDIVSIGHERAHLRMFAS